LLLRRPRFCLHLLLFVGTRLIKSLRQFTVRPYPPVFDVSVFQVSMPSTVSPATQPTALPPISTIVTTSGTAESKSVAEIRRLTRVAENIYKNASEVDGFYDDTNQQAQLVREILELIRTMDELTITITVSQRSLVSDPEFRSAMLLLANNIQHACSELRDLNARGCCGQRDYLGNGKLRQKCIVLVDKVKTFGGTAAFKLDLGTTGTLDFKGDNTANYTADALSMTESNVARTVSKALPTPNN